jgi:hypothetical protein
VIVAEIGVDMSRFTSAYFMLKNNASYSDLGPDHFDRADRKKTASRLLRKLGDLGYVVEIKEAA